jgi:hypothetical protein
VAYLGRRDRPNVRVAIAGNLSVLVGALRSARRVPSGI